MEINRIQHNTPNFKANCHIDNSALRLLPKIYRVIIDPPDLKSLKSQLRQEYKHKTRGIEGDLFVRTKPTRNGLRVVLRTRRDGKAAGVQQGTFWQVADSVIPSFAKTKK